MPRFVIQEAYRETRDFVIPQGVTQVGSGKDAALRLEHGRIAEKHCILKCSGSRVVLEDPGSRGGTFVNGILVSAPLALCNLDNIQIGDVVLIFHAGSHSESGNSAGEKSTGSAFVKDVMDKIAGNMRRVIQGKDDVVRNVLVALAADGHVLLEDVPGVGKTQLAQALARSIDTDFKRIQFTPDMLPNDVTGISVYDESIKKFVFIPGPIFTHVVLADEINRGTPRVQSSLLECMAESMITVDGSPHILRKPFFVIATQNPADFHGTYPLPEAQLDRFIMRLSMGYPDPQVEMDILARRAQANPINEISPVADGADILRCQAAVRNVHVPEQVRDYIVTIVNATRVHSAFSYGCSTRAALALMRAGQALAAVNGREHVMPRDIRDLAVRVLSHRMPLKLHARSEWPDSAQVLESILGQMPIARWEK